jgi:hypothetical protein
MDKSILENNVSRISEWIKAADEKVSIWIAFQGIIITIGAPYLSKEIVPKMNSVGLVICGIVITLLFCFSLYKSISAITPRLKNNSGEKSLLYFGDIARMYFADFETKITTYSEQEYVADLRKQIYMISKIALRKHQQFRDSIISFFISFLSALVIIFLVIKNAA